MSELVKCNKCGKTTYDLTQKECSYCESQKNNMMVYADFSSVYCKQLGSKTRQFSINTIILLPLFLGIVGVIFAYAYNLSYPILILSGVALGLIGGQIVGFYLRIAAQILFFMVRANNLLNLISSKSIKLNYESSGETESKPNAKVIPEEFAERILKSYSELIEKFEQEKELRLYEKDRIIEEWKKATKRREEILNEKDRKIAQLENQEIKDQ